MATIYNITIINNDTYDGVSFIILVDGTAVDLTGASIELNARRAISDELIWAIDNGTIGGITVTDALDGTFEIDAQVIEAVPGVFPYDIQITLSTGVVKTYISGELTVIKDYTHG